MLILNYRQSPNTPSVTIQIEAKHWDGLHDMLMRRGWIVEDGKLANVVKKAAQERQDQLLAERQANRR